MPGFSILNSIGIVATFATAFLLVHRYRSIRRVARVPKQAWIGAGIVFAGQFLSGLGIPAVALYFTPIQWTGYILWIDGAIYSLRGRSLLRNHPAEFAWLAAASVPLWLVFEVYNLRLENWIYVGLPENWWLRQIGYVWAFATIWPGIFETAALLRAMGWNAAETAGQRSSAITISRPALMTALLLGVLFLTIPVLAPQRISRYLFGMVWLGFILFLEPINYWTGRASPWRDLAGGDSSRLRALLWAGMICGLWWEFWNWFAAAKWFYTVPILPDWKMFAMPLPGYLGFPPFAVECFAMFALIAPWLDWVSRKLGSHSKLEWHELIP